MRIPTTGEWLAAVGTRPEHQVIVTSAARYPGAVDASASGAVPNNTASDDTASNDKVRDGSVQEGGAATGTTGIGAAGRRPADGDPLTAPDAEAVKTPDPDPRQAPDRDLVAPGGGKPSLLGAIALYSLLRISLVVVLTAVLMVFMPLIVALMFAIIVQLPLAWLLFSGPRRRVNEAIALASQQRRAERARLQAALTGEDVIE